MNLKEYLINCILEEKDIIEELLYIDNRIQFTSYTYNQLLEEIKNIKDIYIRNKETNFIAITDGEFETVFKVLINIPNLNTIYVDRTSLGINKYLVSRANDFYGEEKIELDITTDYWKYKESKLPIIISGFDTFVEEMSEYFTNAQILE